MLLVILRHPLSRIAILLMASISLLTGPYANAAEPIRVLIEGKPVPFRVSPIMDKGTTLVPFRAVFEAMGLDVKWESASRTIIGTSDTLTLRLQVDSTEAVVNGQIQKLPLPPRLVYQHVFVPLRFIGESTGRRVEWDKAAQTVSIGPAPASIKYERTMSGGQKNGYGKLFVNGVLQYEGEFKNDLFHGQGKKYYADGTLMYEGPFREGLMHGKGKLYREDGSLWYEAEFDQESINGQGIIYFPQGHRLEVGFIDGFPYGHGKYYYGDNTLRFEGEYRDGTRNGFGTTFYANGQIMHEGEFVLSELVRGKLYYETGELWYEGEFLRFQPHGEGAEYRQDGTLIHKGEFQNGVPVT